MELKIIDMVLNTSEQETLIEALEDMIKKQDKRISKLKIGSKAWNEAITKKSNAEYRLFQIKDALAKAKAL